MKVWPPGGRSGARRRADLGNWVLQDERLLVQTRFGGSRLRYGAWRDALCSETRTPLDRSSPYEEYVVMSAFDGNWAQYRDRLREQLRQIMKVAGRR